MAQLLLQEASQLRMESVSPSLTEMDHERDVELLQERGARSSLCSHCKCKWRQNAQRTVSIPSEVSNVDSVLMIPECSGASNSSDAQPCQCRLQTLPLSLPGGSGCCTTCTIINRHHVIGEGNKKYTFQNHCRISTVHHHSSSHLPKLRTVTQALLHILFFLALFTHASTAANVERTELGSHAPSGFLNWDPFHIKTVELSKTTSNEQPRAAPNLVTRGSGIPNRVAVVGRLFRFHIPPTAFSGVSCTYKANEAGLATLPDWLHFNETSGIFIGVPLPSNVGRVYVSVEAHRRVGTGESTADSGGVVESDLFMLKVQLPSSAFTEAPIVDDIQTPFQEHSNSQSQDSGTTFLHSVPNLTNCPQGTLLHFPNATTADRTSSLCRENPLVLANLLFLVNFTLLTPVQRVDLFTKAAQLHCVSPDALFLRNIDWSEKSGMLLWTQIADSDFVDYFSFSTILSFPVTCSSFDPEEELYVTLLTQLKSSLLAGRNGLIVSDEQDNQLTVEYEQWFISTNSMVNLQSKVQPEHHRYRRQVQDILEISMDATATVRDVISSTPFVSSSATSLSSSATSLTTSMTSSPTSSSETSLSDLELPSSSPPLSLIVPPTRVIPTSESSIVFLTRSPTPVATIATSSPASVSSQTFEPQPSIPVLSVASLSTPLSMISTSIVEVVITPTPSLPFTVRSSIEIPPSSPSSSIPPTITSSPISSSAFIFEPSLTDFASSFLLEPFSSSPLLQPSISSALTLEPISSPFVLEPTSSPFVLEPTSSPFVLEPTSSPFVLEPTSSPFFLQPSSSAFAIESVSSSVFILEPSSTPIPVSPSVSDGFLMPMSLSEITQFLTIFTPTPVSPILPELTTDVSPETTMVPMTTEPAVLPTMQVELTPVFSEMLVPSSFATSDTMSVSTPIFLFPTSMSSLPPTTTPMPSSLTTDTTMVPMMTGPLTTAGDELTPVFLPTFVSSSVVMSDTMSTPIFLFPTSMLSLPPTTTPMSSQLMTPSPSLTTEVLFLETTMVPMMTGPLTTAVVELTPVFFVSSSVVTSDTVSTPIFLFPTSVSSLPPTTTLSSQLMSPSPSLTTEVLFLETTMVPMTIAPLTPAELPTTQVEITPVFSETIVSSSFIMLDAMSVSSPDFLFPTIMSSLPPTTTPMSSQLVSPSPSLAPSNLPSPTSPILTPTPSSSEIPFEVSSPLFDFSSSFIFADSPTPVQTFLVPLPTSDLSLSISMFTPSQTPITTTETFLPVSSLLLPETSTEIFLLTETLLLPTSTPVFEFATTQLPLTTSAMLDETFTSIFIVPTSTLELLLSISLTPIPILTPVPSPSICEANVCENGVCVDLVNDFRCDCFPGWTDEFCQTNIDDCEPKPLGQCDITGSSNCSDGNATYTCTCRPGFTGMNCSDDIDECAAVPCLNGATCINFPAPVFFTCNCPPEYSGPTCSVDATPCDPDPCASDEICIEGSGGLNYTCFAIEITTIDVPPSSSPPSLLIAPPTRVIPTSEASRIFLTRSPTPVTTIIASSPVLVSSGTFETTSIVEVIVTPTPTPSFSFTVRSTIQILTPSPPPSPSPSPSLTPQPPVDNTAPQLLNRIGTIVTNEGQLFRFTIPENTFHDAESGSLRNLNLTLLDSNGLPLLNTSWIQLSQNVIEGIPLAEQIQSSAITEYVFLLRAEDRSGAAAHDFVTVRVFPRGQLENFLNVSFEGNFAVFNQNLSAKLDLVTRIASGSSNTNTIYVKEFRNGSIVVSYSNLSISDFNCANFRAWVETIYINGSYTEQFRQAVLPFQATATPTIEGTCNTSTTNINPTLGSTVEIDTSFHSNLIILLATLIPTAVIALVCLLIGIAAVLLYHCRRPERKLLITTDMERTFLNRRPVVLSGEAELPYRSRRPVILPTDSEVEVGGHSRPPTALEEMDHPLASEDESSSEEELMTPFLSPQSRLLPPGSPPPPYSLPPDYIYPS